MRNKNIRILKSLEKQSYTDEQGLIINQKYKRGNIVRVNAGPGVGKTYTLKEFSKKRQKRSILYLAFNKSIQMEAKKKFPKNVTVKTTHSLAFKKFGYGLQHKLSFSDLKPLMISNYFNINSNFKAMLSYEMVKGFMQSEDFEINYDNLPEYLGNYIKEKKINIEEIYNYAIKIWDNMINQNNEDITCTHDTYLKLYQLSKPVLNYDYILIDESQDTNLCVFDIIMRQKKAVKVFVGDTHQSIYGWRGAKNAMEIIKPDYDFSLSNSFRFPQKIADMANVTLENLKKIKPNLKGLNNSEEPQNKIITYIARTNSGVFSMAIETPGKLYFVGGLEGYTFNKIFDAYNLWCNQKDKIKNPFVKEFEDFSEYRDYGEEVKDVEVLSTVRLILNYGRRLPGLLFDIKNRTTKKEKEADLVLTTAHKAKGSEWDHVIIAEDYFPIFDEKEKINQDLLKKEEEINLFYVTITRAKYNVYLNRELIKFFDLNKKECNI